MDLVVAIRAQRYAIPLVIVPPSTSESSVMDFEVVAGAADLALPTIALQHALAQLLVCHGVEPHAGLFRRRERFTMLSHAANILGRSAAVGSTGT